MDATDRRHFPLTLAAANTIRVILQAFVNGVSADDIVYNTPRLAHALDVLSRELRDADDYETDGARRYSAFLFAIEAGSRHFTPADVNTLVPRL